MQSNPLTAQSHRIKNLGTQEGSAAAFSSSQQQQQPKQQRSQEQLSRVHVQQVSSGVEAPAAAPHTAQPAGSATASTQSKAKLSGKHTQHILHPSLPQTSASVQGHFDVKLSSQVPAKQETVQQPPQLKQPPPKKEKIQCLFCTKPARLT